MFILPQAPETGIHLFYESAFPSKQLTDPWFFRRADHRLRHSSSVEEARKLFYP